MTVYVDDDRERRGRKIPCHMWADDFGELLRMADLIGIARNKLRRPPRAPLLHFPVSAAKKAQAVALGAVTTDMFGPAEYVARRNGNLRMLDRIEEARRRQAELHRIAS